MVGFGSNKPAYDVLLNAKAGEVYEVTIVKENGYNQWTAATKSDGSASSSAPSPTYAPNVSKAPGTTTTTSPKSTYETPEERAKKQVYIVRQSSLSTAVDLLSVGQKSKPDVDEVLQVAKRFEDYVFGTSDNEVGEPGGFFDTPKPPTLDNGGDDIPF